MHKMKTLLQYIIPKHPLSRLIAKLADCHICWIKNTVINAFCKFYRINLTEALETDYKKYATFNDFFTRQLKNEARPISKDDKAIISPVDGRVLQIGKCQNTQLITAKKSNFTLSQLLGSEVDAKKFNNGSFAVLYLAPNDYHRIHMPALGTLTHMRYIPGNLFSVNPEIVAHIPNVLARNERVISIFNSDLGPFAVIMVGAVIVGSIETSWAGMVAPNQSPNITTEYPHATFSYQRGDEIGRFKLGSTVILLFPENKIAWEQNLNINSPVKMGNKIGTIV